MSLYTNAYLRGLARNKTMNESRMFSQRYSENQTFDIFLCHSFLDRAVVEGMFIDLTRSGFKVYVDWIVDPQLDRNNVTKQTAELVRKRLRSSKSLLLAISANAALSKWVPWELGYVDGHTSNCGLVPVADTQVSATNFRRSEYLLLYPVVAKPDGYSLPGEKLYAIESSNTYVALTDYINGQRPSYRTTSF